MPISMTYGTVFFSGVAEIDEVLDHLKQHSEYDFLYPMAVLAAHTGARRSELVRSQDLRLRFHRWDSADS